MARRSYSSISSLVLAIAIFFTVLATPAWSEDSQLRAGESFDEFARAWMDSVQELGVPAVPAAMTDGRNASSGSGLVTVRKYGDEFTTELRATGRDGAEYVGILHYSESVYNCRQNNIENCSEPSIVPVTEIFRYDDGRWIY